MHAMYGAQVGRVQGWATSGQWNDVVHGISSMVATPPAHIAVLQYLHPDPPPRPAATSSAASHYTACEGVWG